jgi:hypothetical protein
MAKSAAIVLGNVPEVQKIDQKRVLLKQILKADQGQCNEMRKQEAIKEYENSLILIKSKVLAEHSKTKRQFAEWETSYYENHNLKAPTYEIMKNDEEASVLLKKLKNAKALLKEWNINF